jgi:hypothetical protein
MFIEMIDKKSRMSERRTEHRCYAEIVMDSTTQNSERKDTHVSFHKAKISQTFNNKNPSSVDFPRVYVDYLF